MPGLPYAQPSCHCLTLRQAARQVTQLYDHHLAPTGLRVTQFSVLRMLSRCEPVTMQDFAERLVMDRTTLTRALRPLQRDALVTVVPGRDGRTRVLRLTESGRTLLDASVSIWAAAQTEFEQRYGARETRDFRGMVARVVEQMA